MVAIYPPFMKKAPVARGPIAYASKVAKALRPARAASLAVASASTRQDREAPERHLAYLTQ
jgi:hypothetical protein